MTVANSTPKRNIVLMIADDLGRQLGCYGEKVNTTPNLDALAASGTRFDMAFASTASCSGSRTTIYSGLHTHTNGHYGLTHSFHHFVTHNHIETLPKLFSQAGYLSALIGKCHVAPDAVYPWEIKKEWHPRNVRLVAEQCAEVFQQSKDEKRPFCLTVGYFDPHRDLTRAGFGNDEDYPDVIDKIYDPKDIIVPGYLSDLPAVREELASYFRAINRLDQGVGMLMQKLEESGMADETLVIFMADNGPPFLNSKTTLYDSGVHLPLIVRVPGAPAGATTSAMVSYTDVLPTLLDYAGVSPTPSTAPNVPTRQGRSFLPIVMSPHLSVQGWDQVFGSHTFHEVTNYYPTRYMRNRRFKYHRNISWKLDFPFSADIYASKSWEAVRNAPDPTTGEIVFGGRKLRSYLQRGPEELFDLDADPLETRDLTKEEGYEKVVKEMRNKLEEWQQATKDPWYVRDGISMMSMTHYLGEDGWRLPDRFDFDVNSPGHLVEGGKTPAGKVKADWVMMDS